MGTYAFDKENTIKLTLKINKRTDADIIAWIEKVENKNSYLKQLIRADIAARGTPQAVQEDEHETGV